MSVAVEYLTNKASVAEIADHLLRCDTDFVPPLSGHVEIIDYAKKIADLAMRFEAWAGGTLIGLVAAYCNHQESRIAYITSVSVLRAWMGKGIAARLMGRCIEHAKASGMQQIGLEVREAVVRFAQIENSFHGGCHGFIQDDTDYLGHQHWVRADCP